KMETENPRRARHSAAVRPAMPAPAMATCREGAAMPAPLYAASGGGAGVVGHALGPRLVGAERGGVAIERRAIGADELVVLAHVEEHVWMVEGRRRAHAHEFLDPDVDGGMARVVLEMGDRRVVGHDMLPDAQACCLRPRVCSIIASLASRDMKLS